MRQQVLHPLLREQRGLRAAAREGRLVHRPEDELRQNGHGDGEDGECDERFDEADAAAGNRRADSTAARESL